MPYLLLLLTLVLGACQRPGSPLQLDETAGRVISLEAEPALLTGRNRSGLRAKVRFSEVNDPSRYLVAEVYGECHPGDDHRSFVGVERVVEVDELLRQRQPRSGLGSSFALDERPPRWARRLLERYCLNTST